MKLEDRIHSFGLLGQYISDYSDSLADCVRLAGVKNHWFTEQNSQFALRHIAANFFDEDKILSFIQKFPNVEQRPKRVGLVADDLVPLDSFQEIFYILMSGHSLQLKSSESGLPLIKELLTQLTQIDNRWSSYFSINERWISTDAVILHSPKINKTHYEAYFKGKPILSLNKKHSIAIIHGNESQEDLVALGHSVFDFFGFSDRNISLIWLPKNTSPQFLAESWKEFADLMQFETYKNNMDYHRTLYLLKGLPIVDCDFANLVEDINIISPPSCVHIVYYENIQEVNNWIYQNKALINQVVNSNFEGQETGFHNNLLPQIDEFRGNVNIIDFLSQQ